MNALQVDPKTGFLQNNFTSNYGFTAEKKVQFLELATGFRKEGKFPKVSSICDAIGIDIRSFERHILIDEAFKNAWQEISTHVEYDCISDMSALRTKNPMYMFGLLRYLNPKRWNPNEKQESTLNINVFREAITEVATVKDAVILESSPAIAPPIEQSSTVEQILARDLQAQGGGDATKAGGMDSPTPSPVAATSPLPNSHKTKSLPVGKSSASVVAKAPRKNSKNKSKKGDL